MMGEHGLKIDPNNPWHSIHGLNTIYLTKDVVESRSIWKPSSRVDYENSASLLFGFFNFYACIFPEETVAASIRFGCITLQKTALHSTSRLWRLSVEDPFETCNSHCPHDLGCHVKEDGQKRINESIARAKKEFETVLGMPLETTTQLGGDGILFSLLTSWLGPSKSNTKNETGTATIGAMNRNYLPKSAPTLGRAQNNRVHHQQAGYNGRYVKKMQHQTYKNYPRHNKRDGDAHISHGTNHNATSSRPGSNGNDNNTHLTNDHPRHSKPGEKVPTRLGRKGSDTKIDSNTDVKSTQNSLANQAASNATFMSNQNARLQLFTMENNRKAHSNQSEEGEKADNGAGVGEKGRAARKR